MAGYLIVLSDGGYVAAIEPYTFTDKRKQAKVFSTKGFAEEHLREIREICDNRAQLISVNVEESKQW